MNLIVDVLLWLGACVSACAFLWLVRGRGRVYYDAPRAAGRDLWHGEAWEGGRK